MAIEGPKFLNGKTALADYSAKRYYLVKTDGTVPQVAVCSAATDIPIGVLYNEPSAQGQAADVAALTPGYPIKVIVGSAGVVAGWVGTHSDGTLIQKDTDKQFVIGRVDQSWDSGDYAIVYPAPGFLAV
jgi:hypothetical protein